MLQFLTKNKKMTRIDWVDTTKAIGMFLVFYGHYVKNMYYLQGKNGVAMR